jgi:hypothetical protein
MRHSAGGEGLVEDVRKRLLEERREGFGRVFRGAATARVSVAGVQPEMTAATDVARRTWAIAARLMDVSLLGLLLPG